MTMLINRFYFARALSVAIWIAVSALALFTPATADSPNDPKSDIPERWQKFRLALRA